MERYNTVQWAVGLSNGENYQENNYPKIEDNLSPWQCLLKYIEANDLTVTSVYLFSDKHKWVLPSKGKRPRFQEYDIAEQPISYRAFKKYGRDLITKKEEHYSVIEAEYENGQKLQTWVSHDGEASWSVIL